MSKPKKRVLLDSSSDSDSNDDTNVSIFFLIKKHTILQNVVCHYFYLTYNFVYQIKLVTSFKYNITTGFLKNLESW